METPASQIFAIVSCPGHTGAILFPALRPCSGACQLDGLHRLFQWTENTEHDPDEDPKEARLQEVDRICKKLVGRKSPVERMQGFFFNSGSNSNQKFTVTGVRRNNRLLYESADGTGEYLSEANVYYDVQFEASSYLAQNPSLVRGFWDFRCKDMAGSDNLGKGYNSATIHTGICLFSDQLLENLRDTVVARDQHKCSDHVYSGLQDEADSNNSAGCDHVEAALDALDFASPSLYEMEGVERLSAGVALFARILHERLPRQKGSYLSLKFDIPTVQYFQLAFDGISAGKWSSDQALRWCGLVEDRAENLGRRFQARIRELLQGLNMKTQDIARIRMEVSNGLKPLGFECKRLLALRKDPDIPALTKGLATATHGRWKRYLEAVGADKCPDTFSDLTFHSYVYELLSSMFTERQSLENGADDASWNSSDESDGTEYTDDTVCESRHLILSIDSSAERRTFYNGLKLVKELRQQGDDAAQRTLLIGAYPLERVITSEGRGVSTLYTHDPGALISMADGKGGHSSLQASEVVRQIFDSDILRS